MDGGMAGWMDYNLGASAETWGRFGSAIETQVGDIAREEEAGERAMVVPAESQSSSCGAQVTSPGSHQSQEYHTGNTAMAGWEDPRHVSW